MDNSRFLNINENTINEVCQMVAKAGNRNERRRVLKALNKTQNIAKHANEKCRKDANEELQNRSRDSFGYIMSMFAIVLHDKYKWSDEDIGDMISEVNVRLNGEWSDGKSVQDVANELYEKTGIELRVE